MSAGAFLLTRYELNTITGIVPIRVQPETVAFTSGGNANDAPAGATTIPLLAKTRKGTREYGIGSRCITISWNGSPPTGYKDENLTIPVLQSSVFDGYNVGDAGTYLGTPCSIVAKKNESLR